MGSLFSPKVPSPPPITPPAVMPTPDDAAVQAAKLRQQQAMQAQSGRQSTILTDNGGKSDKLGG